MDLPYFRELAARLADRLMAPPSSLKKLVDGNFTLVGAYAEHVVRDFVSHLVAPARVSTGAVIYPGQTGQKVKQLDTVIWSPNPLPAIFEAGRFALVPRMSSFGILEIKNSAYPGSGKSISEVLELENELTIGIPKRQIRAVLGVIVIEKQKISDLLSCPAA